MKNYIDLTNLPPEQTVQVVEDLNQNNPESLIEFYDHLGLLYGYPIQEIVDVFSRNLMLDKQSLCTVFDYYSEKHSVELFEKFLDALSTENTPISTFQELSGDVSVLSSDFYGVLHPISESLHFLSNAVETEFDKSISHQEIQDQLSNSNLISAQDLPKTASTSEIIERLNSITQFLQSLRHQGA